MEFKVGDKVIRDYYRNSLSISIGTVVKITEKRKDVVVDYGNYKETYSSNGWQKGGDIWTKSTIQLLTPEIREEIRKKNLIWKCRDTFDKKKDLTADQAERILAILTDANLEKSSHDKWIPCDEHLPNKTDCYITTLKDDMGYFVCPLDWSESLGGRWSDVFYEDDPYGDHRDDLNVIAWMPFPEPYKPKHKKVIGEHNEQT